MQCQQKELSGVELSAFKTIVDFVNNLFEYCENIAHNRPLQLYHRLIYKLSFSDVQLIQRQLVVFKTFCIANRVELRSKAVSLHSPRISFSDNIYIDVGYFFKIVSDDVKETIWDYLLTISAHLDPENKTKELLQQRSSSDNNVAGDVSNACDSVLGLLPGLMSACSSGGGLGGGMGGGDIMGMMAALAGSGLGGNGGGKGGEMINAMTAVMSSPAFTSMVSSIGKSLEKSLENKDLSTLLTNPDELVKTVTSIAENISAAPQQQPLSPIAEEVEGDEVEGEGGEGEIEEITTEVVE
jgi:hypothetical protein